MKTIELLLLENVDNLGIVGDVVKVKPGYARNYLMPHGLAILPSEGVKQRLAARRAEIEQEMARQRAVLEGMIDQIDGFDLTLERPCNEQGVLYGGVSQHDVAQAMRDNKFPVEDRMIRLGQQIKRLGNYEIPVQLAADLRAKIKLWVVSDRPLASDEEEPEGEEITEEATQEQAIDEDAEETAPEAQETETTS
jgi:large subunit ribosomal protein L9